MKKTAQNINRRLRMPLFAMVLFTVFACEKGPRFETPEITTLGIGPLVDARVGTSVSVPISFNGHGGAKSVVVFRNGGFLIEIPVERDATQYVYETPVIPESLEEGDEVSYEFLISNLELNDSERLPLTIRAEKYDKIMIGSTEVYNIDIPENGLATSGTIVKLVKGRNYHLSEFVTFDAGSELHIEEGVHVYMNAEATTPVGILIHGEANIIGTTNDPVVFTSSKTLLPNGDPEAGDWGVFRLEGTGPGSSNGTVNYLRIEYPGSDAFRLNVVGSATNISHVQVFRANGVGVRTSGPDENQARMKHIVVTDGRGGAFRLGDNYQGMIQFAIAVSPVRYGELDEMDIRETAKPHIANLTLVGPGTSVSNTHGIRLRSPLAKVYNAIVTQYPRRGVRAEGAVTPSDWATSIVFAHSHVFDIASQAFRDNASAFAPGASTPDFHNSTSAIAGIGANNSFVPDAEQTSTFDPASIDPFFTSAPYVGAVKNANEDWTRGWVKNPDGSIR